MGNKFGYLLIAWLLATLFHARGTVAQTIMPGFTHRVWTVNEGLPINSLNDIMVTDDGIVWISTHNGMVRFDGFTHSEGNLFSVLNKGNNAVFSSNSLYKLLKMNGSEFLALENSQGEFQSIVRYKVGKFEQAVSSDKVSFPYDYAHLDDNQTFWALQDGKIYSLTEGTWKDEFPSLTLDLKGYVTFQVRSKNNIWILQKEKGELYHIENGKSKKVGENQGLTSDVISAFEVTKNGKIWALTSNEIEIIENGRAEFLHKKLPSFINGKGSLYEISPHF